MKQDKQLENVRHSLSHLLAMAVLKKYPTTKLAIGPVIENGFYYDFELPANKKISEDDLLELMEEMKKLIKQRIKFEQTTYPQKKALTLVKGPYKKELINEVVKNKEKLSFYQSGDFIDLCAGPHVKSTKEINPEAFKLTKIAGAYWRGSEKNKMLTRVYGVAFDSKKELDDYLKMMTEAEKRDHRKLGKDLKIFTFSDLVGPGLPLFLPNGAIVIDELEKLAKEKEEQTGYLRVRTPHVAKEEMYKISGHLPYYQDSMFPPMVMTEEDGKKTTYYLKAMNCPHHHQIYAAEPRSYRDLPLRLAEYGDCYRYEKSGELFGLMRVRSMQMNDAHIYCTPEQFADEFMGVVKLYLDYFKIFGIQKYVMHLCLHDKSGLGKKYIDNEKLWQKTETMVRKVMKENYVPFVEAQDGAAFYGPKIDVQIWSAIGHEFTLATNQVDFAVPERFHLTYTDKSGKSQTPLCLHRAPLSTHERLIGFLIEHFAGEFPLWLSPIQIKIISVGSAHKKYCLELTNKFKAENIRGEVDIANETVGNKIRKSVNEKVPYILVVGDKEVRSDKLTVRVRGQEKLLEIDLSQFIRTTKELIKTKSLSL